MVKTKLRIWCQTRWSACSVHTLGKCLGVVMDTVVPLAQYYSKLSGF